MNTGTWHKAGAVGLLAALVSCAHEKQESTKVEPPPPAEAKPPQQAEAAPPAPQPLQPQDELTAAQQGLEAARQEVAKAREQLALAQKQEEQARANVQQLEINARRDLDRASQLAYQAEQAQGLQTATGRVAQATPSRVLLQFQDGRIMSFNVDSRTRVLIGAEPRSVSDIQQGADARVAYDPKGAEPTAITIRVGPVASESGATPPSPAAPVESAPSPRQ
jgi:hypothetical protein